MNNVTKGILALAFLSAQALGAQAEGTGVRGGGQTVDIDGHPALRDLVDKTDCFFVQADDFAGELPEFSKITTSIDRVHWYFGNALKNELGKLSVCETEARLVTIPVSDYDTVTIDTNSEGSQVAIRLNDQIYVDMGMFRQLTPSDQAYTLLHEVTHSFIPMNAERRNTKLRSFVSAVRHNELYPLTLKQFALQMSQNSITIPALTPLVSQPGAKEDYFTALDPATPKRQRQIAAGRLIRFGRSAFTPADYEAIRKIYNGAFSDLAAAVRSGDLKTAKQLLDAGYAPDDEYGYKSIFPSGSKWWPEQYGYGGRVNWPLATLGGKHRFTFFYYDEGGEDDHDNQGVLLVYAVLSDNLSMARLLLHYYGSDGRKQLRHKYVGWLDSEINYTPTEVQLNLLQIYKGLGGGQAMINLLRDAGAED